MVIFFGLLRLLMGRYILFFFVLFWENVLEEVEGSLGMIEGIFCLLL